MAIGLWLLPLTASAAAAAVASSNPRPTLHVVPHQGLTDGRAATITGSGWTPGARVELLVCPGSVADQLTPANLAPPGLFLGLQCGGLPTSATGPSFSVRASLTRVQTFTEGCSSVCSTSVFTCGSVLGDCLVVATATGSHGVEFAAAPIAFTAAHAPTLTVTPNRGLADGQTVTVSGTGYARGETVGVQECELSDATRPRSQRCTAVASFAADASGSGSATFRVRRLLGAPGSKRPDCAFVEDGCVVQQSRLPSLRVPLRFDKATPIIRATLTVTPRDGLVDGQTVAIRGTNFPSGSISVHECASGAAVIANSIPTPFPQLFDVCSTIASFVTTDQAGTFQATLAVSKHPTNLNGAPIDCIKVGCVIDAGFFPDERFNSGFVDTPIRFGTPTRDADCRRGGWRTVTDEHAQPFHDQGECLAWLEHHGY